MLCKAPIVCLCGSTKHKDLFEYHRRRLTLEGKVVLDTGGVYGHIDSDIDMSGSVKKDLDRLHFQKIIVADEILVINPDGRIGFSTCNEVLWALYLGRKVTFLQTPPEWERTLREFTQVCLEQPAPFRVYETFEPEDYDPTDREVHGD